MTAHDDRLYLVHIQECIGRIELYTADGKTVFMADSRTQDAVLRNLHTLAESSQRISEPLKASRLDVDWRAIAAFRNVVVHDYLGIDLNQIWDIVQNDLPGLKRAIISLLEGRG
jgi:uncharacterized protein with HEPN domain